MNNIRTIVGTMALTGILATSAVNAEARSVEPFNTLGPVLNFYDIDGPDGALWFCSTELKSTAVEYEYYTEKTLYEYEFTLYDSNLNVIGSIHDIMRYDADEVRVPGPDNGISLVPVITRNFFNNEDKYEVAISLAVNTIKPGVNHYRTIIYQLDGEKETVTLTVNGSESQVEVDKPLKRINSFVADIINKSTPGNERVFLTFENGYSPQIDIDFDNLFSDDPEVAAAEGEKYWENVAGSGTKITIFSKADAEGNLTKIFEQNIPYQQMQGDQENSPMLLPFESDGEIYLLYPYYKDTFFEPYYSPLADMYMRENNSLELDLYKLSDNGSTLVSKTSVPVEIGTGDYVLATYYSVGDLGYYDDVKISKDGIPSYVVTRCNYTTISDENSGYCYYKYDADGNRTATIFENAESAKTLYGIKDQPAQAMFVTFDDFDGYIYNIVDLDNPENVVTINAALPSDDLEEDIISVNMDRAPVGNGYKYAFEMRQPDVDEDGNAYMRVAWFNADGSFDCIDYVYMGDNVNYAKARIDGRVLDPEFVAKGAAHEYMVLVKRSLEAGGTAANEELIVAEGASSMQAAIGKTPYLHLEPCEKGELQAIDIYPAEGSDNWRLMIGYTGERGFIADFYDLPFEQSAINTLPAESLPNFGTNGQTHIFNVSGTLVGTLTADDNNISLPAGVYIARNGKETRKFIVK